MSNGFSAFFSSGDVDALKSAYSSAVGITAADVDSYFSVGSPVGQPAPPPQSVVGATAKDESLNKSRFSTIIMSGTQPAVVTIPDFRKPQIERTDPDKVTVPTRFEGIFAGQNIGFSWNDAYTPIPFDTPARDTSNKGSPPTKTYDPIKPITHRGYDAWDGITHPIFDIGQRLIPDSQQTFDLFAGGLLRSLKGLAPIVSIDWKKGMDKDTRSQLVNMETFYIENFLPWSEYEGDWLGYERGVFPKAKGQGWDAFALGIPFRLGASFPVTRRF